MSEADACLPQLSDRLFLTDGGIETTLIFHEGLELPFFAAFDLLKTKDGHAALEKYFRSYLDLAARHGTGIILESATWRASPDWAAKLGYSAEELHQANRRSVALLRHLQVDYVTRVPAIVVSGCIGPRGDGYVPADCMTAEQAQAYHSAQIEALDDAGADMLCAITMNYTAEAIGIVRAAGARPLPVAIAFTVETDGRLPTGQTLRAAIEECDAATGACASYYMINCAHPTHFESALADGGAWLARIQGVRANASRMSHAELNEAPELDAGNPVELGQQYAALRKVLPNLNIMGGCCGTDHRHVEEIAKACMPLFA